MTKGNGAGLAPAPSQLADTKTHFGCTACGKCCVRGPEMELSEATALADVFATRLLFRVQAIPNDMKSPGLDTWLATEGSSAPPRQAIDDAHRHAAVFAAARHKQGDGWTRYAMISAFPIHVQTGRCPALVDKQCAIYERRPLSCRTTPFHYSKPVNTLAFHLSRFIASPGYECDSSAGAPVVLSNGQISDPDLKKARRDSAALHRAESAWHKAIVAATKSSNPDAFGLPSFESILVNALNRRATSVSMGAAWALARRANILPADDVRRACAGQINLLRAGLAAGGDSTTLQMFQDMLADCEAAAG